MAGFDSKFIPTLSEKKKYEPAFMYLLDVKTGTINEFKGKIGQNITCKKFIFTLEDESKKFIVSKTEGTVYHNAMWFKESNIELATRKFIKVYEKRIDSTKKLYERLLSNKKNLEESLFKYGKR